MAYYEPGQYDCIVTGQGMSESKKNRTPFFFLKVLPVKRDGIELEGGQYECEVKLYLTETQLRGLGWNGVSFADIEPGGTHSFSGINIKASCTHSENGYENWKLPAPGMQTSDNVSGMSRKLDALFGRALQKNGKPAKKPAPPVDPGQDDIPF
jgi:hypothetical protein